jgi:hypothetical protein
VALVSRACNRVRGDARAAAVEEPVMRGYEFTSDAELRRYLKRLGMTLMVDMYEHPGDVVAICYQATAGDARFGETRSVSRYDAEHLVVILRELRRDLADAARAGWLLAARRR